MKLVIGLVGFIGSGKNTVAETLVANGYHQDTFAAPLKDAVAQIFSWDRELLEGSTQESRAWRERQDPYWSKSFGRSITPREVLQRFGTESMRNVFHQDIWVKSLMRRIQTSEHDKFVVSDVRFQNEIQAIHDLGGSIVRVRRGGEPNWFLIAEQANRGQKEAIHQMIDLGIHQSEWDWIGCEFHHVIDNDGSLDDLRKKVREVIDKRRIFV